MSYLVDDSEGNPGTISSLSLSYSGSSSSPHSSTSVSTENMSTIENGDLYVFTFTNLQEGTTNRPGTTGTGTRTCCLCTNNPMKTYSFKSELDRCIGEYESLIYETFGLNDPFTLYQKYYSTNNSVTHPKGKGKCCPHRLLINNYNPLTHLSYSYPRSDGLLLRSFEKGVLFPVIHWSVKSWDNLRNLLEDPTITLSQGIFKEIKRVIPPDTWLQRDSGSGPTAQSPGKLSSSRIRRTSSSSSSGSCSGSSRGSRKSTWLIIGYKSLEKTLDPTLEATWKEWTGVRTFYLYLRSDFEIRKISFLHRIHPTDNLDLFMYIVLMEIGNVDDSNRIWLMDFVQRMRVERMKGYLSVYSEIEGEISIIDEEYKKCFFKAHSPPPNPDQTSRMDVMNPKKSGAKALTPLDPYSLEIISSEINGNIKLMEDLVQEIQHHSSSESSEPSPIGDYF